MFVKRSLVALGLAALVLSSLAFAREDKKIEVKKVEAGKPLTSKPDQVAPAASIDFAGSLGLSFESLTTLGSRIDAARKSPDPVGLATLATELSVAEKVSGKKASLTGEALWTEAIELARLRDSSKELKALSLLSRDEKVAADLANAADKAAKREDTEAKAFKSGEKAKGANVLHVNNYHEYWVRVFVDGQYVGNVAPNGEGRFFINKKFNAVNLMAYGPGTIRFGPFYIQGNFDTFDWNLE